MARTDADESGFQIRTAPGELQLANGVKFTAEVLDTCAVETPFAFDAARVSAEAQKIFQKTYCGETCGCYISRPLAKDAAG